MALEGLWITSYSGWMHFNPRPVQRPPAGGQSEIGALIAFMERVAALPPLIGGRSYLPRIELSGLPTTGEDFRQREGYFVFAGVSCLNFKLDGTLTGVSRVNRGGDRLSVTQNLEGTYTMDVHPDVGVIQGNIHTKHENTGREFVENDYTFFQRNEDEIYWSWEGSFLTEVPKKIWRGQVVHGVLRRENFVNRPTLREDEKGY